MTGLLLGERTYVRDDGMTVFPRKTFAEEHFHYKDGEGAVFGGPSQRGKTTLAFDLLRYVASPDRPAYFAVSKPDDPVTRQRGKALGYRFVTNWPAPRQLKEFWDGKPPGYIIWPEFGDIDKDMQNCAKVTGALLGDRYTAGVKHKPGILVMDDTMVKAKIMGLDKQMVTIIAMAGAMGVGIWVFVQKPTDSGSTTLWAFENAEHLFFTKGGDQRMLFRYMEIAGDNGMLVREVIPTLDPFQFLYVKRTEGYTCIVDKGA